MFAELTNKEIINDKKNYILFPQSNTKRTGMIDLD